MTRWSSRSTTFRSSFVHHVRGPYSAQLTWYAARSSGLVAWTLASASVLWGLALSTDVVRRRSKPAWLLDLHRFLGGAALIFTGIHVLSILVDTYVRFGLVDVLVPLATSWHPVAVAWGIAGLYLLAAVELTSLARRSLPTRIWRRVHLGSFALFVTTTVHAIAAGTDGRSTAFLGFASVVVAVATGMTILRISRRRSRTRARVRARNLRASLAQGAGGGGNAIADAAGSRISNVAPVG